MPEGDTLAGVARRLAPLVGRVPRIEAPQPRHAAMRIPERLAGRAVEAVEAHGKHLVIRFDGGLVLHSHLRMSGRWEIGPPGRATRRPRERAWLVVATDEVEGLLFNGPVLELLTPAQARLHPALGRLGPDVLDGAFDVDRAVAIARRGPAEQTLADVLLDQRVLAGVGNVWKSEALFDRRLDPWTRAADLDDAALGDLLELIVIDVPALLATYAEHLVQAAKNGTEVKPLKDVIAGPYNGVDIADIVGHAVRQGTALVLLSSCRRVSSCPLIFFSLSPSTFLSLPL